MREYVIRAAGIEATIVPERGGLVTRLAMEGREILFLDRATFENRAEEVRGGIPVLFPFAGSLDEGRLEETGTEIVPHGFAEEMEWEVDESSDDSHRMSLQSSDATSEAFPFVFRLLQTTRVIPGQLSLTMDIENGGSTPMPVAPGWHPYFCCPARAKAAVTYELDGFPYDELSNDEEYDIGQEAPRASEISFDIPTEGRVKLSFSPEMRHLQFWSPPEKEFICVEPWHGPPNVINTEERRLIEPGEAATYWMGISA